MFLLCTYMNPVSRLYGRMSVLGIVYMYVLSTSSKLFTFNYRREDNSILVGENFK